MFCFTEDKLWTSSRNTEHAICKYQRKQWQQMIRNRALDTYSVMHDEKKKTDTRADHKFDALKNKFLSVSRILFHLHFSAENQRRRTMCLCIVVCTIQSFTSFFIRYWWAVIKSLLITDNNGSILSAKMKTQMNEGRALNERRERTCYLKNFENSEAKNMFEALMKCDGRLKNVIICFNRGACRWRHWHK